MELSTVVLSALAEWHLHDFPLASTKILSCCSNISMTLLALSHRIRQFSVTIQIQVPSTERSNFFKQIFFSSHLIPRCLFLLLNTTFKMSSVGRGVNQQCSELIQSLVRISQ